MTVTVYRDGSATRHEMLADPAGTYRLERFSESGWVSGDDVGPLPLMTRLLLAHQTAEPTVGWRLRPC